MADAVIPKSRVIVAAASGRTLLFLTAPDDPADPVRWLTPGGHVEPGESHLETAVRELFEETGLVVTADALGEPVWSRDFVGHPGPGVEAQYHEEYYLLRVDDEVVPIIDNWTPEEVRDVQAWRWFDLDELDATTDAVEPVDLASVVRRILA